MVKKLKMYTWYVSSPRRVFRQLEPILRPAVNHVVQFFSSHNGAGSQTDVGVELESQSQLAIYDNALLIGHYPIAFTHDKKMIAESAVSNHILTRSIYQNIKRFIRRPFQPSNSFKYDRLCVFSNVWSSGYFHWTLDDLTRLMVLKEYYKSSNNEVQLLMVPPVHAWQLDSLIALGFKEDSIVIWNGGKASVNRLYVSSPMRRDKRALKWLRKQALEAAGIKKESPVSKRIYISRADANERKIVNERELFSELEVRGFELFRLSELDYCEQVRLFGGSEYVVGPHGAGLTNLLYARPGATLLELCPILDTRNHYQRLCYDLDLNYERALCENVGHDLLVDVSAVVAVLDRLLVKDSACIKTLD